MTSHTHTHIHTHHPRIHSHRWRETINIELMIHSNIQNAILLTRPLWNHKLGRREGGKRARRCHNSGTENEGRREGGKKSRRCHNSGTESEGRREGGKKSRRQHNSGTESDSDKQYSLQMTSCCDRAGVFFVGSFLRQMQLALESVFRPQRADKLQRRKPRLRYQMFLLGYLGVYGCPHKAHSVKPWPTLKDIFWVFGQPLMWFVSGCSWTAFWFREISGCFTGFFMGRASDVGNPGESKDDKEKRVLGEARAEWHVSCFQENALGLGQGLFTGSFFAFFGVFGLVFRYVWRMCGSVCVCSWIRVRTVHWRH